MLFGEVVSGDEDGFGPDSSPKGTSQTSRSSSGNDYFVTTDWDMREAHENDSFLGSGRARSAQEQQRRQEQQEQQ